MGEEGQGEVEGEVVGVRNDDEWASSNAWQCRICREEEPEGSTSMESPCACSGSLKFAHRSCVQRWCHEKGSTLCEICLQNLEPGHSVPPKKPHSPVTIRGSLEVPRQNHEAVFDYATNLGYNNVECSFPSRTRGRAAARCRSLVIAFTALLLLRHLMDVLSIGTHHYTVILIMFSLRATGILLPSYVVLRFISAIQHGQRLYQLEQLQLRREEEQFQRSGSDEENPPHYTIQILSR